MPDTISLKAIRKPIDGEMTSFDKKFRDSVKTKVPLLDRVMNYIVKRKGKQIRPILVFLSAGCAAGHIDERTHRGAALVELLHTATLIHDDVVDDSYQRRGFFSINALWKNKVAVLVGDYLLSRGLLLSVQNKDFDLLEISSTAVRLMSEGELYQLEKSRLLNITEDEYYDIITKKTASLLASCCAMGARSVTNDEEIVEKFRKFGENLGIAFQIKDDLFDFGEFNSGKPSGVDLKEKKLTLPIIYSLRSTDKSTKKKILGKIRNFDKSKNDLNEVIDFIKGNGGIDYSLNRMEYYKTAASDILETFDESEYKESMKMLIEYVISRRN
ncbi:MAG: polyprenyl synthetase family protein [Bacteroidota bacterium]|nr:polyprenyl synthetase family protein [Bacteroidota bacterium]